jgi:hypothetical protein
MAFDRGNRFPTDSGGTHPGGGTRTPQVGKTTLVGQIIHQRAVPPGGGAAPEERDAMPPEPAGGRPGQQLPAAVRAKMEGAFGADFSAVRVHEGREADELGAEAFAQSEDIHFGSGKYDPGSDAGQGLLGHELAHVVQQRAGRVATPQAKGAPINRDSSLEQEADVAGAAAARGEAAYVLGAAGAAAGAAGAGPIQGKITLNTRSVKLRDEQEAKQKLSKWKPPDDKSGITTDEVAKRMLAWADPSAKDHPHASWNEVATEVYEELLAERAEEKRQAEGSGRFNPQLYRVMHQVAASLLPAMGADAKASAGEGEAKPTAPADGKSEASTETKPPEQSSTFQKLLTAIGTCQRSYAAACAAVTAEDKLPTFKCFGRTFFVDSTTNNYIFPEKERAALLAEIGKPKAPKRDEKVSATPVADKLAEKYGYTKGAALAIGDLRRIIRGAIAGNVVADDAELTMFLACMVAETSRNPVAHVTNLMLLAGVGDQGVEAASRVFPYMPMASGGTDKKDAPRDARLTDGLLAGQAQQAPKAVTDKEVAMLTAYLRTKWKKSSISDEEFAKFVEAESKKDREFFGKIKTMLDKKLSEGIESKLGGGIALTPDLATLCSAQFIKNHVLGHTGSAASAEAAIRSGVAMNTLIDLRNATDLERFTIEIQQFLNDSSKDHGFFTMRSMGYPITVIQQGAKKKQVGRANLSLECDDKREHIHHFPTQDITWLEEPTEQDLVVGSQASGGSSGDAKQDERKPTEADAKRVKPAAAANSGGTPSSSGRADAKHQGDDAEEEDGDVSLAVARSLHAGPSGGGVDAEDDDVEAAMVASVAVDEANLIWLTRVQMIAQLENGQSKEVGLGATFRTKDGGKIYKVKRERAGHGGREFGFEVS